MAKVTAFALQKGGTGKTTSVANTAYVLADSGHRTAAFDFDPQGNLSFAFGVDPDELDNTLMEVILGEAKLEDIRIRKHKVDIYPCNDLLSRLDMVLLKYPEKFPEPFTIFKHLVDQVRDQYEFILLDLPPSLGLMTVNALNAADSVVIPLQCEFFAMHGLRRMINTIEEVIPEFNPNLEVLGVLPTMFDKRTNLSHSVLQEIRKQLSGTDYKVFESTINRATRFAVAPTKGSPAVEIYTDDPAIQEYRRFAKEVFGV